MKPFTTVLAELRGGAVNDELTAAMVATTDQVRKTGRKGKIVLSLVIEPASDGDTERVMVSDDITVKAPAIRRPRTIFFADHHNNLTKNDPHQQRLEDLIDPTNAKAPASPRDLDNDSKKEARNV